MVCQPEEPTGLAHGVSRPPVLPAAALNCMLSGLRAAEALTSASSGDASKEELGAKTAIQTAGRPVELRKHLKEVFKQLLCFLQAAHLGKLVETNDAFIGACGVMSSLMDLQTIWAAAKPKSG